MTAPFAGCTVACWAEPAPGALALARSLVRAGGELHLLAIVQPDWLVWDPWAHLAQALEEAEDRLALLAAPLVEAGFAVDWESVPAPELSDLPGLIRAHGDLVVFDREPAEARLAEAQACLQAGLAAAWPGSGPGEPLEHLVVAHPLHLRNAAPVIAALRGWRPPRTTLLQIGGSTPPVPPGRATEVTGWDAPLETASLPAAPTQVRAALQDWLAGHDADLLALPAVGESFLAGPVVLRLATALLRDLSTPVLIVPGPGWAAVEDRLDAPDVLADEAPTTLRVDRVDALGQARPAEGPVTVVAHGEPLTTLEVDEGFTVCDPSDWPAAVGLAPGAGDLSSLHTTLGVLRPGAQRVGLFDESLAADPGPLRRADPDRLWLAVRLDTTPTFETLRDRTGADAVLDAAAVLDEGPARDVPEQVAPVRLDRVARRLRLRGVAVDVVLNRASRGRGYLSLDPDRLVRDDPARLLARIEAAWKPPPSPDEADLLTEQTGAGPTTARRVEVLLDNRQARETLLERIASAEQRIHLQTYIFQTDDLAGAVADALAAAADRGVTVRLLVDSLYSRSGSLGLWNRHLDRLDRHDRVQLVRIAPVRRLGVRELKRRNHRKLLVVDGRLGRITGRNLSRVYYTGFDEVALTPDSPLGEVPWLDAGADVEGAVVRQMDAAFHQVWRDNGGEDFPLVDPGEPGEVGCRLILHDGLADAHTLDTYRTLFDTARERIVVVNNFPLIFELQHALLGALRRGVEVDYLLGNVRPVHGEGRTPFRGDPGVRDVLTELVHGRVDALVRAGARVREFALRGRTGWDPALGAVRPHVHAKLVLVDGRSFTVGSANLDVTAGYWESEALLLVEDREQTAALERDLARWTRHSLPVDPEDPDWQARASRRAWLSRHWPSLIG